MSAVAQRRVRTGNGLRAAAFLTVAVVWGLALLDLVYASVSALFWVRLGTGAACLALGLGSLRWARFDRWLGPAMAIITTGALLLMSAVTGGVGSMHFFVFLSVPLITAVLVPDEVPAVIICGSLVTVGATAQLYLGGAEHLVVVRFALQSVAMTGIAAYGALRYRRLRDRLDAALQSEARRLGDALSTATGRLFRLRDEREILQAAAKVLRDQGLRVQAFTLRDWKLVDVDAPEATSLVLSELPVARDALTAGRAVLSWTELPAPTRLAERVTGTGVRHLAVDAPLKMDDEPLGLLCVDGPSLNEGGAAAVELFAGQVAAAVENARHHREATQRLGELVQLQGELVARERLAALGEAAAVVAHEVRNPLGAIANATSLLRKGGPAVQQEQLLGLVEEEVRRLDVLVRDMLFLARPLTPKRERVSVAELVDHAVAVIRSASEPLGVALEVALDGQPEASGDPAHLQVALQNLIHNAVLASPRGGKVRVGLRREGDGVEIAVDDEGPGVPAEARERIFEPFFTTRTKGTGLGLAIVQRIAEAHLGRVAVGASPLGGARFTLRLPVA